MNENVITSDGFGRFSKEEVDLIKRMFKDNEAAYMLLKKVFLPEPDITSDIAQTINIYNTIDPNLSDPYAVVTEVKARNLLMGHLNVQMQLLKNISEMREETEKERETRLKKDSSK